MKIETIWGAWVGVFVFAVLLFVFAMGLQFGYTYTLPVAKWSVLETWGANFSPQPVSVSESSTPSILVSDEEGKE
ncbi:MAG: hypothetical protein Q4C70_05015 [Planctomycetia bacterium]|nr:hypothetical protein [Planctomycetia bacterium]